MRRLGLAAGLRFVARRPAPLPVVRPGGTANDLGTTPAAQSARQDQGFLEYIMMPPLDNRRPAKPSAKTAALTVLVRGARQAMAATRTRASADRQGEQAVAFAQRVQILWALQRLRAEKTDPMLAHRDTIPQIKSRRQSSSV
jgi:hypothetical protein